jgi:hypothetical protein
MVSAGFPESSFDPQKAAFSVKVNGHISPYRLMSFFILPEEKVDLEIISDKLDEEFSMTSTSGKLIRSPDRSSRTTAGRLCQWQAPANQGHYPVIIEAENSKEMMTLLFFVQIPYASLKGKETLNNYRIGKYPSVLLKKLAIYKPPKGFAEIASENTNLQISPHFKIDQFLCKQEGNFPKYIVLQTKLLMKLELVLEQVNKLGYRCDTFYVLSGYRTPYYNKSIGNVKYSRHLWGGAADIFIDENPKDNYMDDLNKDGVINWKDSEVIYNIVDDLYGEPFYDMFVGGLGWYRKTPSHGPFVHVDVRGSRARWGD